MEAVTVLVRALAESWARQTYAEAFVILGSLLDVLPSGDRRWVDVLDAMPPDAGWAASYNRIAFDIGPGVAAFREIERVLLEQQRVIDSTVDLESAAAAGGCQFLPRRAPRVVPRRGRRRRDQSREGSRPLRAGW